MLKRQILFFTLLAVPAVGFGLRQPACFSALLIAAVGAWWAASPVTYPKWIVHGLVRVIPLAGIEALALWGFCR